ncbi:MAG: apolipoprotein N-acyltransferase [Verrucomicrobiota bacterium]
MSRAPSRRFFGEAPPSSRIRRWLWLLAVLLFAPSLGHAHNPDTSYARVTFAEREVRFRFTYDLFTLQKIVSLDTDHDGRTTRAELDRGLREIHAFFRRHIAVEIDGLSADFGPATGFVWPPEAGDAIRAADYHTANGLIHFDFLRPVADPPENIMLAFRFIAPLSERHTVLGAFLYGGATHEVTFTRFEPDYDYVTGYDPPLWKRLWQFLRFGVAHIFLGYDHLCFLLALVVASRFQELLKIVTSFTVAHSLTLVLAALDIVRLPVRFVEAGIAATIVYVAVQNLRGAPTERRWLLTFGFGLIHGFGFANVLGEMNLPATGFVRCLLAFNVGVEIGQLAFIAAALPLVAWLCRGPHARRTGAILSFSLGLFGAAWFTDRVWNLGLMPF